MQDTRGLCAVIVPVLNSEYYLAECLQSVLDQVDYPLCQVELVLFNDGSTDSSLDVMNSFESQFEANLARFTVLSPGGPPSGAGSARNRCCDATAADVLIFLDADDTMSPTRIHRTMQAFSVLKENGITSALVGGNFERNPPGSTPRYQRFHESLTTAEISSLAFAFRETNLAMPTLACDRNVWQGIGGFREGRGVPEDLHFLYDAIEMGFHMHKIDGEALVQYRYHDRMISHSYSRQLLMSIRVRAFERIVLQHRPRWRQGFSVWGAGRDGKLFYEQLSEDAREHIVAWGDIDPRKIGKKLRGRPVLHFSQLSAPIALCVTMDRGGEFELNLSTLQLEAGIDYFHMV